MEANAETPNLEANTCEAFARMLGYPPPEPGEWLTQCRERVAARDEEAAEALDSFVDFLEDSTPGERNETYSRAFDLNALFHPYIGYHLFGETYKRSRFMVRLKAHYGKHDFAPEGELPDHLAVVLRFLPRCDHDDFLDELVRLGLLPTLGSMLGDEDALPDAVEGPPDNPMSQNMGIKNSPMSGVNGGETPANGASPGPAGMGQRVGTGAPSAQNGEEPPGEQSSAIPGRSRGENGPGVGGGQLSGMGTAFCQTSCTALKGVPQMETERSEEQREEEKENTPYRGVLEALYLLLRDTEQA